MMGLTDSEAMIVRAAVSEAFGPTARVWLFGSRAIGDRRGDVDLCIELPRPPVNCLIPRLALRRRLEAQLRQKVDIVVHETGAFDSAIVCIAHQTGVLL